MNTLGEKSKEFRGSMYGSAHAPLVAQAAQMELNIRVI